MVGTGISMFAHEKINGLDRPRLLAAIEPVLRAHHVEGVELVWKTDSRGWVLHITIELPNRARPGEGVTLDLCSDISRDLSAALDVAEAIAVHYRLEIGSPGLDRALYLPSDYQRFRGQLAKLKLKQPIDGQFVLQGVLFGLDEAGRIVLDTEQGQLSIETSNVDSARLVLDMKAMGFGGSNTKGSARRRARVSGRGR
jgi:ribosome maturation factor RimP